MKIIIIKISSPRETWVKCFVVFRIFHQSIGVILLGKGKNFFFFCNFKFAFVIERGQILFLKFVWLFRDFLGNYEKGRNSRKTWKKKIKVFLKIPRTSRDKTQLHVSKSQLKVGRPSWQYLYKTFFFFYKIKFAMYIALK